MNNTTVNKGWLRGYIPDFSLYKKINIDEATAMELAKDGAATAFAYFNKKLYFTQSLFFGASISGMYHHIAAIEPSQYGKSFVQAMVDIYKAFEGVKVNVGAHTKDNNVVAKIPELMIEADDEVKALATIPADQFEKLNQRLSKDGLGFANGGEVRAFSFGSGFSDISRNQAIGLPGGFLTVDESALIGNEFDEAFSRTLKLNEQTGERGTVVEISNPHRGGRFEDFMTKETYDDDELVIWMDERVLLAEGAETEEGLRKRYPDKTTRIYRVNIAGEFVANEGTIFSGWKRYDGDFSDCELIGYGIDFGTNHPTSLVAQYRRGDDYIFREIFYLSDLTPSQITSKVQETVRQFGDRRIICDSAGAAFILDMRRAGLEALPVVKGAGSVYEGIMQMLDKQSHFYYHGMNIESELGTYVWKTDRAGRSLDEPVKDHDDILDSIRYVFTAYNYADRFRNS